MSTKSTTIFYFSASGNSLALAKDIAQKTNAELVSIPSVMNQTSVQPQTEAVGIVFPVYYASNGYGIPLIVERFVNKLEGISSKYIFAVCTHSGMAGQTIAKLRKQIKSMGGDIVAGFSLNMGSTDMPEEKQQKLLVNQKQKAELISKYVNAQKRGRYETRGLLRKIAYAVPLYTFIKPIFWRRYRKLSKSKQYPAFQKLIPTADNSYQCDTTKCNGCGTCVKVCPVNNIKIVNGSPQWQNHCETCYACFLWCPKEAIFGDIVSYNDRRHHPEVRLVDIIKANSQAN
ncbi:MAG: EFR1 family ferrodoxin [Candidatus Bathyarchaeota archaeon]|nr:EFR1 family ferrodoxin [Candidatus Bathyarchaeum sp.]